MTDTEYKTDKEYANFLSDALRVVGTKEPNDTDRATIMLCAGYFRGLAGNYEQLQREVVECKRIIAMDTVTVNSQVAILDRLRTELDSANQALVGSSIVVAEVKERARAVHTRVAELERDNAAILIANKMLVQRDESIRDILRVCVGYLRDVRGEHGDQYHGGLGDAIDSIEKILDAAK